MKRITFLVKEDVDGGYTAKALRFDIFTQGETIEKLKKNIIDAVKCHFEERDTSKIINLKIQKEETIQ